MMATKEQKQIGVGDSETERSSNSLPSLPSDIIVNDILTRIPTDYLISSRSVCKSWSNLILHDSDFIKLHSTRTSSPGFIELAENYSDSDTEDKISDETNLNDDNSDYDNDICGGVEVEESEAFQDWQRGLKKSKGIGFYDIEKEKYMLFYFREGLSNKKLQIRGSFYGLVILSCEEQEDQFSHHVFYPIICHSIKLPTLIEFDQTSDLPYFHIVFDPVMKKYKVVCIVWNYIEILPRQIVPVFNQQYFFKIVTLGNGAGSDSWRDIDIPEMSFWLGDEGYNAVSANGFLNLLCRSDRKVLRIDVSRETYCTIEYPKGALKTSKLIEIEESLCILDHLEPKEEFDITSKGKFTLWFLIEDEETMKWVKKYNIDMFHNPSYVASPYNSPPVFIAAFSNPTLKIIFSVATKKYQHMSGEDEDCYYSYDVELKRLESILNPNPLEYQQWHFHRLTSW